MAFNEIYDKCAGCGFMLYDCLGCQGSLKTKRTETKMSLLAYNELMELVEQGVITNVKPEQVNATSIDITLGNKIMIEGPTAYDEETGSRLHRKVSLQRRTPLVTWPFHFKDKYREFELTPGEFILAQSQQVFNLPNNISAEYKLKGSMARIGLEHLNAGWCDAGWNGSVLTLELRNMTRYHTILLEEGVGIGQMVFFKHAEVPADRSYAARGRYNNDKEVSGIKL